MFSSDVSASLTMIGRLQQPLSALMSDEKLVCFSESSKRALAWLPPPALLARLELLVQSVI